MWRRTTLLVPIFVGLLIGVRYLGGIPTSPAEMETQGKDLMLVFTVNNVGYIDVCGCKKKKVRQGSVTRRASLITQLKGKGNHILLLDGGNTLFNDREDRKAKPHEKQQLVGKAKVLVESYNRMVIHVAVGRGSPRLAIYRIRKGDLTGDGELNYEDLAHYALILKPRAGQSVWDFSSCPAAGDYNGDGAITPEDSMLAVQDLALNPQPDPLAPPARYMDYRPGGLLTCAIPCP